MFANNNNGYSLSDLAAVTGNGSRSNGKQTLRAMSKAALCSTQSLDRTMGKRVSKALPRLKYLGSYEERL